jgi:hypothetical protein
MVLEEKIEIREDFIGIFDNFFSEELMQNYIDHFNYCEKNNLVIERNIEDVKDNAVLTMHSQLLERAVPYNNQEFISIIYNKIWPLYLRAFPLFHNTEKHSIYEVKIQKTKPSGGYHIWHCENSRKSGCRRLFVFSLYLNDVKEGGETEFLYQKCRLKTQKNRFILWPAHITHTHRGNPPLTGDKYILTGWMEYA